MHWMFLTNDNDRKYYVPWLPLSWKDSDALWDQTLLAYHNTQLMMICDNKEYMSDVVVYFCACWKTVFVGMFASLLKLGFSNAYCCWFCIQSIYVFIFCAICSACMFFNLLQKTRFRYVNTSYSHENHLHPA